MLQIRALLSELCFSVDGFLMCLRVLHVAVNFGVVFCKFMKGSRTVWRKFELRSALAVLVPPVIIKSDLSIDTLFRLVDITFLVPNVRVVVEIDHWHVCHPAIFELRDQGSL